MKFLLLNYKCIHQSSFSSTQSQLVLVEQACLMIDTRPCLVKATMPLFRWSCLACSLCRWWVSGSVQTSRRPDVQSSWRSRSSPIQSGTPWFDGLLAPFGWHRISLSGVVFLKLDACSLPLAWWRFEDCKMQCDAMLSEMGTSHITAVHSFSFPRRLLVAITRETFIVNMR